MEYLTVENEDRGVFMEIKKFDNGGAEIKIFNGERDDPVALLVEDRKTAENIAKFLAKHYVDELEILRGEKARYEQAMKIVQFAGSLLRIISDDVNEDGKPIVQAGLAVINHFIGK